MWRETSDVKKIKFLFLMLRKPNSWTADKADCYKSFLSMQFFLLYIYLYVLQKCILAKNGLRFVSFHLFMSYKFLVRFSFTLVLTHYLSPVKMSASVNSQTQRPGLGRNCQGLKYRTPLWFMYSKCT